MFNNSCEIIDASEYYVNNFNTGGSMKFVNVILLLLSLTLTYYGNKCVKPVLCALGFLPGFYFIYYVLNILSGDYLDISCGPIFASSLIGGMFTLIITKSFISLAYMSLGLLFGTSIGYVIYVLITQYINLGTTYIYKNSFLITEAIGGLIGAFAFYNKKEEILAISTSFIGAFLSINYLDKLAFKNQFSILAIDDTNMNIRKFAFVILYVVFYFILSISGYVIQYRRYKKKEKENSSDIQKNQYINYN